MHLILDSLLYGSFNVNGIQGNVKRRKVYNILKDNKLDIAFLQETHSVENKELIWQNEYGGNIFYSHGTSEARGVAILFKRGLVYQIKDIKKDLDGRFIAIEVKVEDITYLLCNVYSPNEDDPSFFVQTAEIIESFDNPNIIWGGDFNLVLDVLKDRYRSNHNNSKALEILLAYMQEANLVDVWRIKNPDDRIYSWFRRRPLAMSRIDFFLISESILPMVTDCRIIATPVSDHSLTILKINVSKIKKGPGLWQFNVQHLRSKSFLQGLNQVVENTKQEVDNLTPVARWEKMKSKIRSYCQNKSSEVTRHARNTIMKLYEKLKSFRDICYSSPQSITDEQWDEYEDINQEFDKYLEDRAQGARLRCKVKWFEQGERSSKYFFSLEKANSNSKMIRALQLSNGSTSYDNAEIMREQVSFYKKLYAKDHAVHFHLDLPEEVDKLSDTERQFMDKQLSKVEIATAILAMPNNKTPGDDGLPIEVYKVLWSKADDILYEAIVSALESGKLMLSA